MRNEISSAVDFLSKLLKSKGENLIKLFKENLSDLLCEHYENHWFTEKPMKGSAYRCMRIVNNKMDPILTKAGASCGIPECDLLRILPAELTMWVDPEEVSYRIGEDGSIGVLYDGAQQTSETSSPCESPSSSPVPSLAVTSPSPSPDMYQLQHHQQQQPIPPQDYSHQYPSHHNSPSQEMFQSCKDQARTYNFMPGLTQDSAYLNAYFAAYVSS